MRIAVTMLVFSVAALVSLGLVMLYSSSMGQAGSPWVPRQLIWCGLGLIAGTCAALLDYRQLKRFTPWIFGLTLLLLALVLVPGVGVEINGARRWFDLGVASFQPSELGKIGLILLLAWYGERHQRFMKTFQRGIVLPGLLIGATLALVFLEPDYGTTMLLAVISGMMLLMAGVRIQYFVPPAALGLTAFCFAVFHDPVRLQRVMAFLQPEEHKLGKGYQAYQAMIALGSGGPTGLGLGNGRQKLGFIPEHHTDFIYSVIGEELGLVATLAVILLFLVLLLCGILISWRASDTFGSLLAAGITFLITVQAFINIGVVTSALPNKGLPLPFISHGGSSLLVLLASVGLLISVARFAHNSEGPRRQEELPISDSL